MRKGKLIVICQSGGEFLTDDSDGSMKYVGGDAHAISVDRRTKFKNLMNEIAEMWKYDPRSVVVKYFVPGNTKTLVTVSSDKDMKNMIDFYEDSGTVDIYVMQNLEIMPCSSSSKDDLVEPVTPIDVAPPISSTEAPAHLANSAPTSLSIDVVGQVKFVKSWENCITGLHQQFNNVQELREALRKYSIACGFTCAFKKNDSTRVSAKCKEEGCPWRLYASKLSTTNFFRVKRYNSVHTCGVGTGRSNCLKASRKMVASIFKEKLSATPNSKPKEIVDQLRQELGIDIKYSQAWRGIEIAREQLQGSFKKAYGQLPGMCERIVETNPGSVVTLVTREDHTFHRLFVGFDASINGFQNGCRPLIFLHTTNLTSKYQSELLTATALDGNDGLFPVAFAIVDVVNDDNWYWFLSQLKTALSASQPITFIGDRQMGLRQSIPLVFENSYHGYCLDNLSEELKKSLQGPHDYEVVEVLVSHLYDAANAPTLDGFRRYLESIRSISPEAYEWILRSEPEHWADSLFAGLRYKHVRSGIAESFYSSVADYTVLQIIDNIRCKTMELIYNRKVEAEQWSTKLTPNFEEKLQKEIVKAQLLQVSMTDNALIYEVHDSFGAVNTVNVDAGDCSCGEWQLNGLPCSHAVAVLQHIERNLYDYCSKFFTTDTFRLAYAKSIYPIPSGEDLDAESSSPQVLPPCLRLTTESPKERKRKNRVVKRPLHCSKCKGEGHNRSTCQVYT